MDHSFPVANIINVCLDDPFSGRRQPGRIGVYLREQEERNKKKNKKGNSRSFHENRF
jgi:hypothetical protein